MSLTENDVGDGIGMTPMRIVILDFIRDYTEAHGWGPSVREIRDAVGMSSTSSVHHQLRRLEDLGEIVRGDGMARAIRLAEAA